MIKFLEAFDGYVIPLIVLVVALLYRGAIRGLLSASTARIKAGSQFSLGAGVASLSVGATPIVLTTEDAQENARARGQAIEVFGDPDQLKVLFKVQAEDWKKSTKALSVPGGCLVQMTTERRGRDGSWTTSEALQFVPDVTLLKAPTGEGHMLGRL